MCQRVGVHGIGLGIEYVRRRVRDCPRPLLVHQIVAIVNMFQAKNMTDFVSQRPNGGARSTDRAGLIVWIGGTTVIRGERLPDEVNDDFPRISVVAIREQRALLISDALAFIVYYHI